VDAYDLGIVVTYPQYPDVPSESTGVYDLEDVVFDHVARALEVRSGDNPPLALDEEYDEAWNLRTSGTTDGLSAYYSATSHSEVHEAGGTTLALVRAWIRESLAP
jgi:hypothetical protein